MGFKSEGYHTLGKKDAITFFTNMFLGGEVARSGFREKERARESKNRLLKNENSLFPKFIYCKAMYKSILKPLLFSLSPEKAHHFTTKLFQGVIKIPGVKSITNRLYNYEHPALKREVFGLTFNNPVGLAAGFDKDGKYIQAMSNIGFGFLEIGTVTPKPQVGNLKPRLFRLPESKGLINRMGFNNDGVEALVERLKNLPSKPCIIGGNIGKNKITPNSEATNDYVFCFEALFPYVDYFVVNVSSPNTPGLRELQEKKPLTKLLLTLQENNQERKNPKPILLKIAPDLTNEQLDDIIDIIQNTKTAGVIATNTTIDRSGLVESKDDIEKIGTGGLSGAPLKNKATAVIKYLHEKSNGSFPIIGVGGICSEEDALEKLEAGATLIQVYSGMVYEGPGLVKRICKEIIRRS